MGKKRHDKGYVSVRKKQFKQHGDLIAQEIGYGIAKVARPAFKGPSVHQDTWWDEPGAALAEQLVPDGMFIVGYGNPIGLNNQGVLVPIMATPPPKPVEEIEEVGSRQRRVRTW